MSEQVYRSIRLSGMRNIFKKLNAKDKDTRPNGKIICVLQD